MNLAFITWNFNPSVIPAWDIPRWYGIMWALGFLVGIKILEKMFKSEKSPKEWVDKTFIYVLLGAILGARLGHLMFYEPWFDQYNAIGNVSKEGFISHPFNILKIWEGGLASHGGVLGIAIAAYLLKRNVTKKHILWGIDRIVVPTGLAGCFIRLGNLFNHEILGKVTDSSIGFKFLRDDTIQHSALTITGNDYHHGGTYSENLARAYSMLEANPGKYQSYFDMIPVRYPAQLMEAICYLVIFGIMMLFYWKSNAKQLTGLLTGLFFTLVFGARFFVEFIKESQGGTDSGLEMFNMGQRLSIPLVLFGLFLIFRKIKELKFSKAKA